LSSESSAWWHAVWVRLWLFVLPGDDAPERGDHGRLGLREETVQDDRGHAAPVDRAQQVGVEVAEELGEVRTKGFHAVNHFIYLLYLWQK